MRDAPCVVHRLALAAWPHRAVSAAARSSRPSAPTVDLVHFGVSVVDKQGKPVTGLTAEDFQVVENGKTQSLKFFAAGDPEEAPPLHSACCSTPAAAWRTTSRTRASPR